MLAHSRVSSRVQYREKVCCGCRLRRRRQWRRSFILWFHFIIKFAFMSDDVQMSAVSCSHCRCTRDFTTKFYVLLVLLPWADTKRCVLSYVLVQIILNISQHHRRFRSHWPCPRTESERGSSTHACSMRLLKHLYIRASIPSMADDGFYAQLHMYASISCSHQFSLKQNERKKRKQKQRQ